MRRVLITGGSGFVGPHLIQYLRPTTSHIAVIASENNWSPGGAPVQCYQADIRDEDTVRCAIHDFEPSEIYHLAGISAVGESWASPRLTFEVNVIGTYNVFEAAMSLKTPARVLNISTAQVYAASQRPLTEDATVAPENPYGASKAMAELLAVTFRNATTGGIITARSFNHTGPGQLPTFVLPSLAKQFAEIEAGIRPPRLAVGNVNVTRDFADVRDVVRAYAVLMERGKSNNVYNVCSGIGVRVLDLIDKFQAVCRAPVRVEKDPARLRPSEIPVFVGDPTKIRKETGWKAQISMDRTIRDLMDYWRDKTKNSTLAT